MSSYATYVGRGEAERVCDIAARSAPRSSAASPSERRARAGAARAGLRLGLENHPERTPAELLAKIGVDADVLGATVDTGWWGTQGYDAARAIEELAEHVLHVHLKDVRAAGEPHETCPWGEGVVPIEGACACSERLGYAGAIAVSTSPRRWIRATTRRMRLQLEEWLA